MVMIKVPKRRYLLSSIIKSTIQIKTLLKRSSMLNLQSPPGYININELLKKVGTIKFQDDIDTDIFQKEVNTGPSFFQSDYSKEYELVEIKDLKTLENILQQEDNLSIAVINIISIYLGIYRSGGAEVSKTKHKEVNCSQGNIKKLFSILRVRHFVRKILSEGQLLAFFLCDGEYRAIHKEFWHDDSNWYRLLADGCFQGTVKHITNHYSKGSVYFNKEEAESCLSGKLMEIKNKNTLINLENYSTPWLEVLNAIFNNYGKAQLATEKKEIIEIFIAEHVKCNNLNIAKSDFPMLAKFIRLAEQKEGKKYYSKKTS